MVVFWSSGKLTGSQTNLAIEKAIFSFGAVAN